MTYGDVITREDGLLPRLSTISKENFDSFYREEKESFDVAVSMSSLDHDGEIRFA